MTAVHQPATVAATLPAALAVTVASRPDAVAVRTADGASSLTWRALEEQARRLAAVVRGLGVQPGDTVAVHLTNSLPFYVADLGVVLAGAVPVPIYATASAEQIAHVADDAGVVAAITEAAFAPRLLEGLAGRSEVPVLCVEPGIAGTFGWDDRLVAAAPLTDAELYPARADDLLTIIYTSGTTGRSKGVELTHAALLGATASVAAFAELGEDGGRVVSWLPLAHIAERVASYYGAVAYGLEVVVCPDPAAVAEVLPAARPTFFFAVPRFWEKLRAGIEAKIAALPEEIQQAYEARTPEILGALRQAVGLGEVRVASVGAAPCDPDLITFFHELGIPLGEIYGMTENAACCTVNPLGAVRIGSAGLPMPGVELRIGDDGEVEMRGPSLMARYRNLPDATVEAFTDDGFLRTGDIGRLDEDGYLWLFDRKKEISIGAGGKNMSPSAIEAAIASAGAEIGHVCAIGDRRPYNVALVVPDRDVVGEPEAWPDDLDARIAAAVERGNARLARVEQVKRFHVVRDAWLPGGRALTPTMKLRRRNVEADYAEAIQALYDEA
ncbi:MAG: AMP-dependent synthetase/ligase [Patulibacter minatonensis]